MPTKRRSDTPEFSRIIESDLAKANRDLAALVLAVKSLQTECANLKHQVYAKDKEIEALRKLAGVADEA